MDSEKGAGVGGFAKEALVAAFVPELVEPSAGKQPPFNPLNPTFHLRWPHSPPENSTFGPECVVFVHLFLAPLLFNRFFLELWEQGGGRARINK